MLRRFWHRRSRCAPAAFSRRSGRKHDAGLWIECLETRALPSSAQPLHILASPQGGAAPLSSAGPVGYTPSQIRHAYGFDQITYSQGSTTIPGDGRGLTIAIVDAYDNPTIATDLHNFDQQFGLPDPVFTKVNQTGGSAMPAANNGWSQEIALDVEWAHAIASAANILLVEANSNSFSDLLTAVRYAARQPGVVAVSMSWGGPEFATEIN